MLIKNTSLYFIGELVNRASKLLSLYLLARLMTKAEFGGYSYILSTCLAAMVFLDFGLNTLVMMRTSQSRFAHLLPVFFLGKLIIITGFCAGLAVIDSIYGFFGYKGMIWPFLALCIGWDATAFLGNALRMRMDFKGEFVIKVTAGSGFLALLIALIVGGGDVDIMTALWLQAASFAPAVLLGYLWTRRGVATHLVPARHARRGVLSLARIGAPMTLAAFAGVTQTSIDSIVLGAGSHLEVNASFTLVNRLGQIAQLPVNILIFSGLPYIVEALRGGKVPDNRHLRVIITVLIASGTVIGQIFVLFSEWLLPLALGPQYSDVRYFAPWLGFYIIAIYIYPVLSNLLCAMRHVVATQLISGGGTILNLILDILVIRFYGPYAVAWVVGGMQWVLLLAYQCYYRLKTGHWAISRAQLFCAGLGGVSILAPIALAPNDMILESLLRLGLTFAAVAATAYLIWQNRQVLRWMMRR